MGIIGLHLVPAVSPEALIIPRHDLAGHQHVGLISALEFDCIGLSAGEPLLVICGPVKTDTCISSTAKSATLDVAGLGSAACSLRLQTAPGSWLFMVHTGDRQPRSSRKND